MPLSQKPPARSLPGTCLVEASRSPSPEGVGKLFCVVVTGRAAHIICIPYQAKENQVSSNSYGNTSSTLFMLSSLKPTIQSPKTLQDWAIEPPRNHHQAVNFQPADQSSSHSFFAKHSQPICEVAEITIPQQAYYEDRGPFSNCPFGPATALQAPQIFTISDLSTILVQASGVVGLNESDFQRLTSLDESRG